MTEFTHRNPPVASGPTMTERVATLRAAPRTDATADTPSQRSVIPGEGVALSGDETARARADYARVSRDIADVVDSVAPPRNSPAVLAEAEHSLLSLLPEPSVILPLPPADRDMVAFVAQVTQSIARQTALTRAALSGIVPAVVEAATSS